MRVRGDLRGFGPGWSWGASVLVHTIVLGGVAWVALVRLQGNPPPLAHGGDGEGGIVSVEPFSEGEPFQGASDAVEKAPSEPRSEGAITPRLDTGSPGRGGERSVDAPAIHLSDRDERIRLSRDLTSHLVNDQEQRLHTAASRSTREDRRSSREPMELTLLASGTAGRLERRPPHATDPSRGADHSAQPASPGVRGENEIPPESDDETAGRNGSTHAGRTSSPGMGVHDVPVGEEQRRSARVARARPLVTPAPPSVAAREAGRPRDTVDSDQEVSARVQSIVHASSAGGQVGRGIGGSEGSDLPGVGGRDGPGSHSPPLGATLGPWVDFDTQDPRILPYFRRLHAKLDPLFARAFPRKAVAELKQGTVIMGVRIASDGSVRVDWPPLRPSGIDEFDSNCARAVREAAPFEPLPKSLGTGTLSVRMKVTSARMW